MQPPRVFKSHLAENVIRDAIDERVSKTMKYNALKCRKLSIDLADLILRRVKRLGFKRSDFKPTRTQSKSVKGVLKRTHTRMLVLTSGTAS